MVRPAFGFLALALAIAHPRYVTALPGLVTVPLLGNPSQTHSFTAVQLGVDSQSGYTTYGIEDAVMEGGPSGYTTLPYTATLIVGSDRAAITASFTGTFAGTGDHVAVMQDEECDLTSHSAICKEPLFGTTITVPLSSLFPWVIDVVSTGVPSPTSTTSNSAPRPAASIYGVLAGIVFMASGLL
ncbi:hypothetical protein K438DRAFT_1784759 [Mycena galopus ATCC 62051]|nr:hypothetical protein K438DRAFT_1784759 [Mycena galopus ATCC 62051]